MKTPFKKLESGDKFIRIPEIESEAYTSVYRKLFNSITIRLNSEEVVVNAVRESSGVFIDIPYDEEVILLSR